MFGYIQCNKDGLSKQEISRYRDVYCGICKMLGQRFGTFERLYLNFDMTFGAILLSSLYEPDEEIINFRCPSKPIKKHSGIKSIFTEYAADMTIALTYHKLLDDWIDDKKYSAKWFAGALEKGYNSVKTRYPRQCNAIEESLFALSTIEKDRDALADEAVKCSGRMLADIFVYQEDYWSQTLYTFGYELGCFIFLMDAVIDYEKDKKKGRYNPIIHMNKRPEEMDDILNITIGNAVRHMESLPLIQDLNILRNVLYSGIWTRYYRTKNREKDNNDTGPL